MANEDRKREFRREQNLLEQAFEDDQDWWALPFDWICALAKTVQERLEGILNG